MIVGHINDSTNNTERQEVFLKTEGFPPISSFKQGKTHETPEKNPRDSKNNLMKQARTTTIYPQLSEESLKRKLTRLYVAWVVLRTVFKSSGVCQLKDACDTLQKHLNIKRSDAYHILDSDKNNVFWFKNPKKTKDKQSYNKRKHIWLRSPQRVAHAFDIDYMFQSRTVNLSVFFDGVRCRRANVYRTAICKQDNIKTVPVSREKLEERTGVRRPLQRVYDRYSGIDRKYNFARVDQDKSEDITGTWAWIMESTHGEGLGLRYRLGTPTVVIRKSKPPVKWNTLIRQLPNTYHDSHFSFDSKRTLNRVNGALFWLRQADAGETNRSQKLHPYLVKGRRKSDEDGNQVRGYKPSKTSTTRHGEWFSDPYGFSPAPYKYEEDRERERDNKHRQPRYRAAPRPVKKQKTVRKSKEDENAKKLQQLLFEPAPMPGSSDEELKQLEERTRQRLALLEAKEQERLKAKEAKEAIERLKQQEPLLPSLPPSDKTPEEMAKELAEKHGYDLDRVLKLFPS